MSFFSIFGFGASKNNPIRTDSEELFKSFIGLTDISHVIVSWDELVTSHGVSQLKKYNLNGYGILLSSENPSSQRIVDTIHANQGKAFIIPHRLNEPILKTLKAAVKFKPQLSIKGIIATKQSAVPYFPYPLFHTWKEISLPLKQKESKSSNKKRNSESI